MSEQATVEPPETFEALKDRLIEIEPRCRSGCARRRPMRSSTRTNSPSAPRPAIARNADVQASTLVRFAQTLGFAGFSDLQEVFRSHLRNRWPDYSERLKALHESARDSGDPLNLLRGFADSAASSVARLRESVDRRDARRRGRSPGAGEDHLLPRPASRLQRRALSELRARPARAFGRA